MAFWFVLKIWPNLWMFFLWMLLFGIYVGGKLYGVVATRFAASFWMNVVVTMLILLGPAVQDSTRQRRLRGVRGALQSVRGR